MPKSLEISKGSHNLEGSSPPALDWGFLGGRARVLSVSIFLEPGPGRHREAIQWVPVACDQLLRSLRTVSSMYALSAGALEAGGLICLVVHHSPTTTLGQ